jgi:hypothetical protein
MNLTLYIEKKSRINSRALRSDAHRLREASAWIALGTRALLALLVATFALRAQAENRRRFDYMSYTVPPGFVAQSESNPTARAYLKRYHNEKFGMLTIYASTGSFGDPQTDFSRRWRQLLAGMSPSRKEPNATSSRLNNANAVMGYDKIKFNGGDAVGLLMTITVKSRLLTFVAIYNAEESGRDLEAFLNRIDIDDDAMPAPSIANAAPPSVPATTPSRSSAAPITSATQQAGDARFVGRWIYQPYTSTVKMKLGDFRFRADGTFHDLMREGYSNKKMPPNGRYYVAGNTLKLVYENGVAEEFSFEFSQDEVMSEQRRRFKLFTTNPNDARYYWLQRD